MWLLSCDGSLFEGKRIWLRPGTTHLLGRTTGRSEAGERIRYIEHKSVSRKHLTINVAPVKAGDSTKLHVRPEITVKDGSKIGTTVSGDKFSQDTRTLSEKEYTIKLGNYEHLFHLWWQPVTLSFTNLSKKSGRDVLAPWREKLEQAGVKLAMEYVTNETTHVIAKKRNTVAVLQGLLQARWVITDGFAEALSKAVARKDGAESSPLEEDFDANWPNEEDFFVPSGAEPKPKPNEYLKPDPARSELFQDFVFVFMSQGQHDTLLSVITAGGGKALLREVDIERTTVQDFVEFLKEVAGRKNSNQFRLSQQTGKGGIVVARMQEREGDKGEFMRNLDLALDQRSVEQNEFLDAILIVDASGMRKQLEEEPSSSMAEANTRTANSRPQSQQQEEPRQQRAVTVHDSPSPAEQEPPRTQPQSEQPEQAEQPSATTKRRNRRIITQSRFKGFDDFDPSQFSKPVSQSPEPSFGNREASQAPSEQNMDVVDPSQQAPGTHRSSRKRPAPPPEEPEDEEDLYATILPGHAAMKRQKTLAAQNGNDVSFSKAAEQLASEKAAKAKKKTKQMDVKAEIEARRQAEEERYRQDQEALRATVGEEEMKNLKNLAIVEEMELPVREPIARARGDGSAGRSDRWDTAWNGRKNFKKFRPQGQRGEDGPRLQRVIVALEEVPRKGHGIGEEFWLSSSKGSNKSKSQSQSQSQYVRQGATRSQAGAGADEEHLASFRRRSQRDHDQGMAPMEDIIPEEIAGLARDENIQAMADANSSPSQTMRSESQRKAPGKRAAAQPAAGAPATKKAKPGRPATWSETINVDDDDDDALKFRRRRRAA